ncbi:MAG: hypothetical protein AMK73_04390 [Planctomycetes bacterium SM23_32]|nr:MAG: hypothetical protein AMK73_04390 [Planctomycetes bacterium SM23_32]
MGRIEDYVEAATRRLRCDPELCWDVARELRAHLEDAAEEARAGGAGEAESIEAALEAFGGRDELAEQLYRANRGRMRLRAAARWANRLVLVPLAVAAAVLLASFTAGAAGRLLEPDHRDVLMAFAGREPRVEPRSGLSEEERFLFGHVTDDELEDAEKLVARWPDDPVLYAHYVRLLSEHFDRAELPQQGEGPQGGPFRRRREPASDQELAGWLAALDRGEQVEPDNAFYDYLKAALLVARSSREGEDDDLCFEYEGLDGPDDVQEACVHRLAILDRAMFEQSVGEVLEGVEKPFCTSHVAEIGALREQVWEPARTLEQWAAKIAYHAAIRMPHVSLIRQMNRRLPAYAVVLMKEGRTQEAARLASIMHRPSVQIGAGADMILELLVAMAGFTDTAGAAPEIFRRLGMPEEAAEARRRFQETIGVPNAVWRKSRAYGREVKRRVKEEGSVIAASLMPAAVGPEIWEWNAALRKAEHAYFERMALGLTTGVLAAVTVVLAAAGAWGAWRHGSLAERPKLLFVGWRRVAGAVLVGVALYALTVLVTGAAAYAAVRRRCREAGMEVGPAGWLNPLRNLRGLLAAALPVSALGSFSGALAAYRFDSVRYGACVGLTAAILLWPPAFVLWQLRRLGSAPSPFGQVIRRAAARIRSLPLLLRAFVRTMLLLLALGLLSILALAACALIQAASVTWVLVFAGIVVALLGPAAALAWAGRSRRPWAGLAHFRRTVCRSMVPVLAACLLALSLAGHGYLTWAEARYLAPISQPGIAEFESLEGTMFTEVRDHMRGLAARETPRSEDLFRPPPASVNAS